jgi:hypothetical protein
MLSCLVDSERDLEYRTYCSIQAKLQQRTQSQLDICVPILFLGGATLSGAGPRALSAVARSPVRIQFL